MDARAANQRIAEKAQRLHFYSRVPMLCECSTSDCRTLVLITLQAYREIRRDPNKVLTAPGHDAEQAELESETSDYDVRRGNRSRGERDGDRRSA